MLPQVIDKYNIVVDTPIAVKVLVEQRLNHIGSEERASFAIASRVMLRSSINRFQ